MSLTIHQLIRNILIAHVYHSVNACQQYLLPKMKLYSHNLIFGDSIITLQNFHLLSKPIFLVWFCFQRNYKAPKNGNIRTNVLVQNSSFRKVNFFTVRSNHFRLVLSVYFQVKIYLRGGRPLAISYYALSLSEQLHDSDMYATTYDIKLR